MTMPAAETTPQEGARDPAPTHDGPRYGRAAFFDGVTSARHDVTVVLGDDALTVRDADGATLASWPYGALMYHSAPAGMLRLGIAAPGDLARLDIRDEALAAEIDARSTIIDRSGVGARRDRLRVIGWSMAAMASLVIVGVFAIPELAARLAPLVPVSFERQLGRTVENEVRTTLRDDKAKPFECGADNAGAKALREMIAVLSSEANLPFPIIASVIRNSEANAIALPGGRIFVFEGLIDKAETPDELAGVIAHEIGHVAHRDGIRAIFQATGLSFLFGMILGDFVGGGAVVAAAKSVAQSAYSRDAESAADRYGVDLLNRHGWDGGALGTILGRIAGSSSAPSHFKLLLDHPDTRERIAAIEKRRSPIAQRAALAPPEWAAIKAICKTP